MNIYSYLYKIKRFPYTVKYCYQRAKRGYSCADTWSIRYWFMETMPKILEDFKKNLRGCPAEFVVNADGTERPDAKQGFKNWATVIERMIFCFTEMNEETCSMKNEYDDEYLKQVYDKPWDEMYIPKEYDSNGKVKTYSSNFGKADPELEENYHKKERMIEAYRETMKNEGFDLFKEYFWDLWD